VPLLLSEEERAALERGARRARSARRLALRCRIVLLGAEGLDNRVVAARLHLNAATVSKWRRRFAARRLDGLVDDPRPGAVRTISDAMVEAVIARTLEEPPAGLACWSTRSMAKQMGMSQSAIVRIWRAAGLPQQLPTPSRRRATPDLSGSRLRSGGRGFRVPPIAAGFAGGEEAPVRPARVER
jgi:transposase